MIGDFDIHTLNSITYDILAVDYIHHGESTFIVHAVHWLVCYARLDSQGDNSKPWKL